MAYDTSKLTNLAHLKTLAQKVSAQHNALAEQVNNLAQVGAEKNLLVGVNVNGTALNIAERMVDILIAQGSSNGKIAVNGVDVAVKGLAALAYKANVSETELSDALKATLDAKATTADLNALKVLVGEIPEGSTATTITGYVAETVSNVIGGAPEAFDTLQEIAAWIASDEEGAVAMATSIQANATKITELAKLVGELPEGSTATDVVSYIAEAVATIGQKGYVTSGDMNEALKGYVETEEGKGLSQENFTSVLKTKLDGLVVADNTEVTAMIAEVFATA